jgi:hypothetical protein
MSARHVRQSLAPATSGSVPGVPAPRTFAQVAIFAWGVLGSIVVVGEAAARLLRFAYDTLKGRDLGAGEITFAVVFLAFILYAEGYRGFQQRFSPRTVARAVHLAHHPRALPVLLAPVYCMALFGTTRRRLIASWILIAGIVALVILVRYLPPVHRALVDAGVGCALTWGLVSMGVYSVLALRGRPMPVPADIDPGS